MKHPSHTEYGSDCREAEMDTDRPKLVCLLNIVGRRLNISVGTVGQVFIRSAIIEPVDPKAEFDRGCVRTLRTLYGYATGVIHSNGIPFRSAHSCNQGLYRK